MGGSEELYEGVPVQVRVTEPAGPWSPALRELASPEWIAIAKLADYLSRSLQDKHTTGVEGATPMEVVDLAIQTIESGRRLAVATYEQLEPRLREMIRRIAAEQEPRDGA